MNENLCQLCLLDTLESNETDTSKFTQICEGEKAATFIL